MDSLTQIILGAAVGEAVAGKKMGNKAAMWGAIAGTIPDLDVFIRHYSHPIEGALMHRGFSHSIVFALIITPILAFLVHKLYKNRFELNLWRKLFFLSIITHPMLDIFTSYGTQFFWPFELRWTFNSVFVVDPLYTVPFGLLLLFALFLKRDNSLRRKLNKIGLIYSCVYLFWGVAVKLVIVSDSSNYFSGKNIDEERTLVTPMPFTSFYWMVLAENEDNYFITYKSLFYSHNENDLEIYPKNHQALEEVKWSGENYTETLKFLTKGYYSAEQIGDTLAVYDLRFGEMSTLSDGASNQPLFGYGMVVDNGIVNKTIRYSPNRVWKDANFGAYFDRIFSK
ncbi:MAG: metal-dependent hydrolase [Fluviicola sp.]|nr:metal-dependent hydrolase [Fluviicola sp.]